MGAKSNTTYCDFHSKVIEKNRISKKEILYNKKSRELLLKELQEESFKRITGSFYRYRTIKDLEKFRDILYKEWSALKIYGRIYISEEGINAQFSCPEQNLKVLFTIP